MIYCLEGKGVLIGYRMNFINDLEDRLYEVLRLENLNKPVLYIDADMNHRLLEFPKKEGEDPEKTLEIIANATEDFLVKKGFKIFHKIAYTDTPYKTQNMTIEKRGEYYVLTAGGEQAGNLYRMNIRRVDFPSKN